MRVRIQQDIKNISLLYKKSPYFSLILLNEIIPIYQFSFMTARPVHEHELQQINESFKSWILYLGDCIKK